MKPFERPKRTAHSRVAIVLVCGCAVAIAALGCTPDMKARAYAPNDRDEWQQPDRVIGDLQLRPGMRVADLGAGGGYFSFRLAEAVGPTGRVYAVDVDEAMNERLEALAQERGVENLRVVLADADSPRLPEPVDLVFTSNTYHHLPDRVHYFERLKSNLRSGGRVAVVEYRKEGFMQSVMGHATQADQIRKELEAAGYERIADFGYLERQSFSIFAAK